MKEAKSVGMKGSGRYRIFYGSTFSNNIVTGLCLDSLIPRDICGRSRYLFAYASFYGLGRVSRAFISGNDAFTFSIIKFCTYKTYSSMNNESAR